MQKKSLYRQEASQVYQVVTKKGVPEMWNVHEQRHDSKNNPNCMVEKPSQNQMPDKESIRGLLGQFCDRRQQNENSW